MSKPFFLLLCYLCPAALLAQWTTSGSNIYNSNSGYVGIGTTTPSENLSIRVATDNVLNVGYQSLVNAVSIYSSSDASAYHKLLVDGSDLILNLRSGGKVGIGTANPAYTLDVNGTASFNGSFNASDYYEKVLGIPVFTNGVNNLAVDVEFGNNAFWGYIELEITGNYSFQNSVGKLTKVFTIGAGSGGSVFTNESRVSDAIGPIQDNISIGELIWDNTKSVYKIPISHITNTGNGYNVKVRVFSYGAFATGIVGGLGLSSIYTLAALSKNYVNYNGNVGIGTADPGAYKLAVNGDIKTRKITVTQTNWPDYVFHSSYKLKPLSEVAQFIKQNQHLPDVPSANEVEEKGLSLGDNQVLLLKKIEELTLYIIGMGEQMKLQNVQIKKLQQLVGK